VARPGEVAQWVKCLLCTMIQVCIPGTYIKGGYNSLHLYPQCRDRQNPKGWVTSLAKMMSSKFSDREILSQSRKGERDRGRPFNRHSHEEYIPTHTGMFIYTTQTHRPHNPSHTHTYHKLYSTLHLKPHIHTHHTTHTHYPTPHQTHTHREERQTDRHRHTHRHKHKHTTQPRLNTPHPTTCNTQNTLPQVTHIYTLTNPHLTLYIPHPTKHTHKDIPYYPPSTPLPAHTEAMTMNVEEIFSCIS
jgi:hypothetical protein